MYCKPCKRTRSAQDKHCFECGDKLHFLRECKACKVAVYPSEKFCTQCGAEQSEEYIPEEGIKTNS